MSLSIILCNLAQIAPTSTACSFYQSLGGITQTTFVHVITLAKPIFPEGEWPYFVLHAGPGNEARTTMFMRPRHLPFSITALTHQGAAPNACFHWEPIVCVQTNTVHSRHTTKMPHWREGERSGMCGLR